jgi:hypothetical protein
VEVGFAGTGPHGKVVVTEVTPLGRHVLELSADNAEHIGALMVQTASKVRSGLVLPPGA